MPHREKFIGHDGRHADFVEVSAQLQLTQQRAAVKIGAAIKIPKLIRLCHLKFCSNLWLTSS
jgi:hypothetical protein